MKPPVAHIGRLLVGVALLGLSLRALVPAGFMAAPLVDGWPVMLCHGPSATPAPATPRDGDPDAHAGHHGRSEAPSPVDVSSCPPVANFSAAIDFEPSLPGVRLVEVGVATPRDVRAPASAHADSTPARAPPITLLVQS